MAVYVDAPIHQYGRMIMCHMLADTDAELHEMADRIGIKRKWFQDHSAIFHHYDICKFKRNLAIQYGAIEIGMRDVMKLINKRKEEIYGSRESGRRAYLQAKQANKRNRSSIKKSFK